MSCSGLHCAGCAGGAAIPVVPLIELCGLAWVAEHIVEVAIVSAVCGALAAAAVVALMRWGDRREARHAAGRPFLYARAETVPSVTQPAIPLARLETPAERPALAGREVHIHLDGMPAAEHAAVIRQALHGKA